MHSTTIEENETAHVFFSNPRLTKGHLLVVPNRHVEKPWELTTTEIKDIFALVHKYQKLLAEKIGTGCDVRQNYRPFLPESELKIDHIHFHLIPRTLKDEIFEVSQQFEPDLFKDLSDKEKAEVLHILSA